MKKTIIVVSVVLVLALAAYFLFRKPSEPPITDPATGGGGSDTGNKPTKPTEKNPMPLKIGSGWVAGSMQNTLVKDIQDALNTKHNAGLVADGKFGPKTLKALLANNYPGVIFWKQYSAITGKQLSVGGTVVDDSNSWSWWPF